MGRLDPETLARRLAQGQRGGVFFLFGDDEFSREEAVSRVVDAHVDPATRDFNLDQLRGTELDPEALPVPEVMRAAAAALGADPLDWVLGGGEDHALAAVFPAGTALPDEWRVIGRVVEGGGVRVAGRAAGRAGWDHFR